MARTEACKNCVATGGIGLLALALCAPCFLLGCPSNARVAADSGTRTAPLRSRPLSDDASTRAALSIENLLGNSSANETPAAETAGLLGACIQRSTQGLTTELREGLNTLGYTQFAEDSCRLSLAATQRDVQSCDRIVFRTLADTCRLRVAIARGERELCPEAVDEPGPDPLCVALATRNYSACPGAGISAQNHCRAIAENDAERCHLLPGPFRIQCEENVRALLGTVPTRSAPQPNAGSMHLRLEWLGTTLAPTEYEAAGMDRGAFATESRGVVIVDPRKRWPQPSTFLYDRSRVAVGVALTVGEQRTGNLRAIRIILPDGRVVENPVTVTALGTVQFTKATLQVGHELVGEFSTVAVCGGRPVRVTANFATFIRDEVRERVAREGVVRALPSGSRDE